MTGVHSLVSPSDRPGRSQDGAAGKLRSGEAAAPDHEVLTTEQVTRLTYVLQIDAGHRTELDALIARIPGARFRIVSSNHTRPGTLPVGLLSQRLEQVLQLIRQGLSNKAIGRELGISHFTVRNHVARLLYIYGADNRDELIAISAALKLD